MVQENYVFSVKHDVDIIRFGVLLVTLSDIEASVECCYPLIFPNWLLKQGVNAQVSLGGVKIG